jgi:hypothetical protein
MKERERRRIVLWGEREGKNPRSRVAGKDGQRQYREGGKRKESGKWKGSSRKTGRRKDGV